MAPEKKHCSVDSPISFNLALQSVDCQQLKQTGARSAGRSAAWNDFILTACMHNMTWGGPGTQQSGCGRRDGSQGPRGEDLGGGWQHAEHWLAQEDSLISFNLALQSVDCQQLKQTGARLRSLKWLYSDCLHAQYDMGGTWHTTIWTWT
jgi:hypothetical protein